MSACSQKQTYELQSLDPDILANRVYGKPPPSPPFSAQSSRGLEAGIWGVREGVRYRTRGKN